MKRFGSASRNGGLHEGKGSDIIRNLSASQPSRGLRRAASGTNDEPSNGPSFNTEQKLSDGGVKPLADLMGLLGLGYRFVGDAVLRGADPIIRSHALEQVIGSSRRFARDRIVDCALHKGRLNGAPRKGSWS
jgi:hypothetical protein